MSQAYRRLQPALVLSILLIALLALTACNSEEPAPQIEATPIVVDTPTPETNVSETDVSETDVMTDTDVITDTQDVGDTDTMTGTDVITHTDTMTGTDAMTPTEGITDTDTMTDTGVVSETQGLSASGSTDTGMIGVSGAEGMLIRGFALQDYEFENIDGEVSGELEDLLIDLSTGDILFASIEYGGFLDLGDTDIVVPLSAFAWSSTGNLVLNFDEQSLENFPDLGNNWPDITDSAWDDDVTTFWRDNTFDQGIDFDETNAAGVMWLSDMTGFTLVDLGSGAGTIHDVLVDMGNSRIQYVLFGFGTTAADDDSFIIPYRALDVQNINNNEIAFDSTIDLDTLLTAPRYDSVLFPDTEVLMEDLSAEIDNYWTEQGFEVNE